MVGIFCKLQNCKITFHREMQEEHVLTQDHRVDKLGQTRETFLGCCPSQTLAGGFEHRQPRWRRRQRLSLAGFCTLPLHTHSPTHNLLPAQRHQLQTISGTLMSRAWRVMCTAPESDTECGVEILVAKICKKSCCCNSCCRVPDVFTLACYRIRVAVAGVLVWMKRE